MKTALLAFALATPWLASAQSTEMFKGADLALGTRLIAENKCAECHASKVGGDGSAIYRPRGRVNNPDLLRAMVENCSMQLKLQLFPEEVTAIAAVLNRDFYRFK